MPACAERISSKVGEVLGITKAHMSPGALHSTAVSAALVAGISLVSILQAGDLVRISTPARHYLFTYIITMDLHQHSIQQGILGLGEKSFGKCQTLIYVNSWQHVGHSCLQYQVKSFSIVCAVLELDSYNFCSGEQGTTSSSQILPI